MATNQNMLQRQARVLERLDEGHKNLHASLEGLDPADAFLGSRWSVWEVLNHLDTEKFVAALEDIAAGKMEMLPPFNSREKKLKEDVAHLDENYQRFRALVAGLTEEQMSKPVTAPNPENFFPALTLLELVERSSGHEARNGPDRPAPARSQPLQPDRGDPQVRGSVQRQRARRYFHRSGPRTPVRVGCLGCRLAKIRRFCGWRAESPRRGPECGGWDRAVADGWKHRRGDVPGRP